MPDVRLIDPCRDGRWDRFVAAHPFGWITHLAGWKSVLEQTFTHLKPRYIALFGPDGQIVAALPLFEVKSIITGHRFVSLPFATLCDPLVSNEREMEALLSAMQEMLKETGARYVELRTHMASAFVPGRRFSSVDLYKNQYLPLNRPPDVLKASFHRSCVRQRIARAERSGLAVRAADNESDLKEFYRLHSDMRKRLGLPAPPFAFLRALWRTFFPIGQLSLLLSTFKTKVIGGIILFKFKERVSAEFLGWDERYRDMSPTHHLFWEAIKAAHAEGRRIFDFGRSSLVDTSLSTFKGRWGTSLADIRHYYYPPDYSTRGGERDSSLAHRAIRHMCRTLPEPAFRLVGMFCYRHLA